MTNEQWVEEATIAAAETGADRELDYDPEGWQERWLERNGRGPDGSPAL